MDPIQVAVLTLIAIAVGVFIPVMIQFALTLRQVQADVRDAKALLGPTLADIRGVMSQVKHGTQVTSAVGAAIAAGVQAWLIARKDSSPTSPPKEDTR